MSRPILLPSSLLEVILGQTAAIGGDLLRCSRKFGHTSPLPVARITARGSRFAVLGLFLCESRASCTGFRVPSYHNPSPQSSRFRFTAITRSVNTTPWWHIPSLNKTTNGIAYCIPGAV
jgi:hypothetical protein